MKSESKWTQEQLLKYQTLPMELQEHFDDPYQWCLMEVIWFRSNFATKELRLNDLNKGSSIKSRGTLLTKLQSLVAMGWVTKIPYKESGKHHRYTLNRAVFIEWAEKVLNKTSQKSQSRPQKSDTRLSKVLIKTEESLNQDSIDNIKIKNIDNGTEQMAQDNQKSVATTETTSGNFSGIVDRAFNYLTEQTEIENTQSPSLARSQLNGASRPKKNFEAEFKQLFGV